jgi:curved DNA-binding protein CbpA
MVADPRAAGRPLDAYAVLEVAPHASGDDIRRAYRRLARLLHPDANPGDGVAAERFRQVVEAYEILGDPIRRLDHDRRHRGAGGPRAVMHGPAPSGNTTVRGPHARPSHVPRTASQPSARRPETDEWSFLGGVAKWVLGATVAAVVVMVIAAAVLAGERRPASPMRTGGVPGGTGFCLTPDGWVACRHVEVRGP